MVLMMTRIWTRIGRYNEMDGVGGVWRSRWAAGHMLAFMIPLVFEWQQYLVTARIWKLSNKYLNSLVHCETNNHDGLTVKFPPHNSASLDASQKKSYTIPLKVQVLILHFKRGMAVTPGNQASSPKRISDT